MINNTFRLKISYCPWKNENNLLKPETLPSHYLKDLCLTYKWHSLIHH